MACLFRNLCFLFRIMAEELQLLHWSEYPECHSRLAKYFEGYHSLQLLTRGHVSLSYDEESHELGGTCFWFHYPGPLIRLRPKGGSTWHHRYVAFRGSHCEKWLSSGLLAQAPLSCPANRRAQLTARFDDILVWADEGSVASLAKASAALELLLWEIWEIRRNPTRHRSVIDALTEFAEERRFRVGSYGQLAASLGLSSSSLRRQVLEATGLPVHRFVRTIRLQNARRLLRQTDRGLADIASVLGFPDVYYFSREFSRLAGMGPAAYRRSEL